MDIFWNHTLMFLYNNTILLIIVFYLQKSAAACIIITGSWHPARVVPAISVQDDRNFLPPTVCRNCPIFTTSPMLLDVFSSIALNIVFQITFSTGFFCLSYFPQQSTAAEQLVKIFEQMVITAERLKNISNGCPERLNGSSKISTGGHALEKGLS